ncbi:hypothetical protein [Shewanella sp. KCT]|uniref:hypothetical protein n=1 Tax=Shewanella sp. KCT TaxID=2569535 RepID=UPI001642CDF5|nr:hypothetical protein [Shewanella sp. KCT]
MSTMDTHSHGLLFEGYWWLSLLGGLHCIGLGLYLRYLYRDRNDNHKLLGAIFSLLALYFLTGLLNRDNSPLPLQQLFILLIPAYFLLMPMLYLYCYRSLHDIKGSIGLSRHFIPAIALVLVIGISVLLSGEMRQQISINIMTQFNHVTLLGTVLPLLLLLQTGLYFYAILRLLRRFKGRAHRAHQDSLKDIKFRWLLALTLAMLTNWLVRMGLVILPYLLGDKVSLAAQASTRLFLLLSLYLLALYGLKQITMSAYLRGRLSPDLQTQARPSSSRQLLSAEELNYLQQLLQSDKK